MNYELIDTWMSTTKPLDCGYVTEWLKVYWLKGDQVRSCELNGPVQAQRMLQIYLFGDPMISPWSLFSGSFHQNESSKNLATLKDLKHGKSPIHPTIKHWRLNFSTKVTNLWQRRHIWRDCCSLFVLFQQAGLRETKSSVVMNLRLLFYCVVSAVVDVTSQGQSDSSTAI